MIQFWNPDLISELPSQLLRHLHRSICRWRSSGWSGTKSVKISWHHQIGWTTWVWYHSLVINEMFRRGWKPSTKWLLPTYRGRKNNPLEISGEKSISNCLKDWNERCPISIESQRTMIKSWMNGHKL